MKTRVATVRATGRRYLVKQLMFTEPAKALCWGELVEFKGLASRHEEGGKIFLIDEVEVVEVEKTADLLRALVAQRIEVLRAAGHVVTVTRSGNYVDRGTAAQAKERAELTRSFIDEMEKFYGRRVR